jgi:3-phosphoshikimate 1-carboxyvinyltransferase
VALTKPNELRSDVQDAVNIVRNKSENVAVVFKSKLNGVVRAPPSKSYTHRALFLACIANGKSRIKNVLLSRDTIATINACKIFGANISPPTTKKTVGFLDIEGAGLIQFNERASGQATINAENSGTTLRIATALASSAERGTVTLTGDDSLQKRPMQPLLDCLNELGSSCKSLRGNGCVPIVIECRGLQGGE